MGLNRSDYVTGNIATGYPIMFSIRSSMGILLQQPPDMGPTGFLKFQFTCKKTVPGPGSSSATTAFKIALVTPTDTGLPGRPRTGVPFK